MGNAAEKRKELEEKLAKLTGKDLQKRIEDQKAKLELEIEELSQYKDYEGKVALAKIGDLKVKVIINGYARQAFRRALFSVSPLEGEGSTNISLDKLEILEGTPAA